MGVASSGSPSSSWIVPTAIIGLSLTAATARPTRPNPYPLPFTTGIRPVTDAATSEAWFHQRARSTVRRIVTALDGS